MFCITLPVIENAASRLRAAFPEQLFIELDGSGWCSTQQRCIAALPTRIIKAEAGKAEAFWKAWQQAWTETRQPLTNGDENGIMPGWFGFLGYDLSQQTYADDFPVAMAGFFPCIVVLHADHTSVVGLEDFRESGERLVLALEQAVEEQPFRLDGAFQPDTDFARYKSGFDRIKDYILAGDCYQVNYAQRFTAQFSGNAHAAYRDISRRVGNPFSAYVACDSGEILSFSPEQFVSVEGDLVTSSPIKGTRPRNDDPVRDAALRSNLQGSIKDRAENLMIVDLLRNDLSRVAQLGTVRVPALFSIESFRHVHHMVSVVQARLAHESTAIDVLHSCFPGGSITGAPKRRACEIITEVEAKPRSVYCGNIFHLDVSGRLQSNIMIRTILARNGVMHCWGGGGVVADSVCEDEYQETFDKVGGLMALFGN